MGGVNPGGSRASMTPLERARALWNLGTLSSPGELVEAATAAAAMETSEVAAVAAAPAAPAKAGKLQHQQHQQQQEERLLVGGWRGPALWALALAFFPLDLDPGLEGGTGAGGGEEERQLLTSAFGPAPVASASSSSAPE